MNGNSLATPPQESLLTNHLGEIWDLHGHLAGAVGDTPELRMQRLLHFADRMKISKICVYMGMNFSYDPTVEEMQKQNAEVLRAIQSSDGRALGFVYLNPKHTRESLSELEKHVANGPMVGVKLWVAMRAHQLELDPLVARAAELDAVVFQHTWIKVGGNLHGESTPMDLKHLAERHPQAKLICGHSGGDWEQGIRAIQANSNVAVELGGGDPTNGFTEMAVRELGADRVLYGSDIPGRSFATQLAKVLGAHIDDQQKSKILAGNLKRLLEPILRKKGMWP